MSKESYVLWWLARHGVLHWVQRVIDGKVVFTFPFRGKVWSVEYTPEELDPGLECDVRVDGAITYFGSVEDCLKIIKRAK